MSEVHLGRSAPFYLGIDLGWTTGCTGLATVSDSGRLMASGRVRTDAEIAAWIDAQHGHVLVSAVDAPLIVPNETGQRLPERLVGQVFGGFGASAHTSNRAKFGGQLPRAMRLAHRFGWVVDPSMTTGKGATVCIEVYPHPAMIGLFRLGYRLDYKKGNVARRSPGFAQLVAHLESIPELQVDTAPRWGQIRETLAAPAPGDLTRIEDELDAIFCAHLAWLWHHRPDALHVYGNVEDGYIVAPPPPSHQPVVPEPYAQVPVVASAPASFSRTIAGRPTGYSSGANEQRWKAAIRAAFAGCCLPAEARLHVDMQFMLTPEQTGQREPDVDNLIKAAIDALDEVIGLRPRFRGSKQADDVRVNRITASKRPARNDEKSGAHAGVLPL